MEEKSIWQQTIAGRLSIDSLPQWPCPRCNTGYLLLDKKRLNVAKSRDLFRQKEFEKDDFGENLFLGLLTVVSHVIESLQWLQARFSGLLYCTNKECKETVSVIGRAEIWNSRYPQGDPKPTPPYIIPEYFSPSLQIFKLKTEYPTTVRAELGRSFSVFFSEPNSAGSRLRSAVERLMEANNVAGNTLHAQLIKFSESETELGELLQAIKLLGNEGSHSDKVTKQDVLDGYEVFNHVLDELYNLRSTRALLKKTSTKIADKYKPKSTK